MKNLTGLVFGVNLAVVCAFMQGCKAPTANAPARTRPAAKAEPAANVEELPAVAAEPLPPAPIPEVKPLPPAPAPVAPAAVSDSAATTPYAVRKGDMLSKICRRHGVRQSAVLKLNPGLNPNRLRVGQTIQLPGNAVEAAPVAAPAADAKPAAKGAAVAATAANVKAPAKTREAFKRYTGATKDYEVRNGDTLGKIAADFNIKIRTLKEMNGLKSNSLRIGQKLKVPVERQAAEKPAKAAKAPAAKGAKGAKDAAKAPKEPERKGAADAEKKADAAPVAVAPAVEPAVTAGDAAKPEPAPVSGAADGGAAATDGDAVKADDGEKKDVVAPAAPAAPAAATHTVKDGEDLVQIAIRYGTSLMELKDINGLTNEEVKPGQVLKLPAGARAQ